MADAPSLLASLKGLRSAPTLSAAEQGQLSEELMAALATCEWFTVGVMAPSATAAVASLRALEARLSWEALELDPSGEELASIEGPVFLKANQNTGRFLVRRETGLEVQRCSIVKADHTNGQVFNGVRLVIPVGPLGNHI